MSQLSDDYRARTGQGTKFYFTEDDDWQNANWIHIPGTTSASGPSFTKNEIDVTTTYSTAKEYITGLPDPGSLELGANFDKMNSIHRKLLSETLYKDRYYWVKLEDVDGFYMVFNCQLMGMPLTIGVDAATVTTLTWRISGQPVVGDTGSAAVITWDSTLAGADATGAVSGSVIGTLVPGSVTTSTYTDAVTDAGAFTKGTHYNITGVPSGLTAVLTKTSATVATLTFTGTATTTKDVSNISLTLMDLAFKDAVAAGVAGSSKSGISITFA